MSSNGKIAFTAGAVTFIVGLLGYILAAPIAEFRCLYSVEALMRVPEGTSTSIEPMFWPPGSRCIHEYLDGRVETLLEPMSVGQWVTIAVLSTLVAVGAVGITKLGRRARGKGTVSPTGA